MDVATGEQREFYTDRFLFGIALSPDGRTLATVRQVSVWNIRGAQDFELVLIRTAGASQDRVYVPGRKGIGFRIVHSGRQAGFGLAQFHPQPRVAMRPSGPEAISLAYRGRFYIPTIG